MKLFVAVSALVAACVTEDAKVLATPWPMLATLMLVLVMLVPMVMLVLVIINAEPDYYDMVTLMRMNVYERKKCRSRRSRRRL